MNVLIVDDQVNVLNGIKSGVRFAELGIDTVFYATGSEEALRIIAEHPIDILVTDIEMPGDNGLILNEKIARDYPDMVRILLTAHADFKYMRESLRLNCFDYVLQPAPYEEIEDSLRRTLQFLFNTKKNASFGKKGEALRKNKTEYADRLILNLFSRIPEDVDASILDLREIGFPLDREKDVLLVNIDVQSFSENDSPLYSEKKIHQAIADALTKTGITYPILALTTVNRFKYFVLILTSATSEPVRVRPEEIRAFFEELQEILSKDKICLYLGDRGKLSSLRDLASKIYTSMEQNINKEPGIFLASGEVFESGGYPSLYECGKRWKTLLETGQKEMLLIDVNRFLKVMIEGEKDKFRALCELHQQLTHIFFSYFYDNNADLSVIFDGSYRYSDYMDSFRDVESFRKGIRFMIAAIDRIQTRNKPISDVEKAKTFISDHVTKSITVKDVADYVRLSPEYFTKLFKRETGQNIKEFITLSKIAAATEMLEHSDLSVGMIGLELGYANFSHFSQVFKRYKDVTPSEYRFARKS